MTEIAPPFPNIKQQAYLVPHKGSHCVYGGIYAGYVYEGCQPKGQHAVLIDSGLQFGETVFKDYREAMRYAGFVA